MADELNMTVPHEGDDAPLLDAAPITPESPGADGQPAVLADASSQVDALDVAEASPQAEALGAAGAPSLHDDGAPLDAPLAAESTPAQDDAADGAPQADGGANGPGAGPTAEDRASQDQDASSEALPQAYEDVTVLDAGPLAEDNRASQGQEGDTSAPSHMDKGAIESDVGPTAEDDRATQDQDASADEPQWEYPSDGRSTALMPTATAKLPEVVEVPEYVEPSPADEPQLRDVGATLAGWLRGRARAAASFVSNHRLLLAVVSFACVFAVLAAVLLGIDASKVPSDELIKRDAQSRLIPPSYTVGNYANDDALALASVEIERKGNGSQRDVFEVDLVATFTNSSMQTQADALLTYVREGDDWECIEATVGKASHRATAGVSEQRVLEQAGALLQEADTADGTEPLSELYRDAAVEVTGGNFNEDAQTDSLNLHFTSNGTFVSYECYLSANFRFAPASGAWELASAIVSDGARDLGFGPLLGTWKGTFTSQKSSSFKCLAARDTGLTVVITRADMTDNRSAVIEGTLSGLGHLHPDLTADANATEGDTALDAVPFSGTLSSGNAEQDIIGLLAGDDAGREQVGIVFDCTAQDLAGGSVALTLEFGQAKAPDAASATLTTTYNYEDTFLLLMPYQREARFADAFTLEKVG